MRWLSCLIDDAVSYNRQLGALEKTAAVAFDGRGILSCQGAAAGDEYNYQLQLCEVSSTCAIFDLSTCSSGNARSGNLERQDRRIVCSQIWLLQALAVR